LARPASSPWRYVALVLAGLAALALWLGTWLLTAAYLGPLFGRGWPWVGVSALLALGLPIAAAVWLVRPLTGFKRAAWFTGVVGFLSLAAVLGLSTGAPRASSRVLRGHGPGLLEQLFGPASRSNLTRRGSELILAWAELLQRSKVIPVERPAPKAPEPSAPDPVKPVFYGGYQRSERRPTSADRDPASKASKIPFAQRGGALVVRARIRVGGKERPLPMILDTGATISAITREAALELGLRVKESAVQTEVQTAGGLRSFPVAVLDVLRLGTVEVRNLTVAICDPCSPTGLSGLLGLNFTSHFVATIDPGKKVLTLARRTGAVNRLEDVEPFLRLTGVEGTRTGNRFTVKGGVHHLGPRTAQKLKITAVLLAGKGSERQTLTTVVPTVAPGGQALFTISGEAPRWLSQYRLEVTEAFW
jgi:clan AA aspartic protease (TIGR02281 family)